MRAFLFPGQGSQQVGMGKDLFDQTALGRQYFERANEILGVDIQEICFYGPEDRLRLTRYTQPAIYIVSVLLGTLLIEKGIRPEAAAGHSLGEFSAFTIARAFDFESGLKLVSKRAEAMQMAGETQTGTMAAIVGLNADLLEPVLRELSEGGQVVVAANYNSPQQIVISGTVRAVQTAMQTARSLGALKAVELNVSGAFHSPLMTPAKEALAGMLNSTQICEATIPVYTNVSADPVTSAHQIRAALQQQLVNPVRWHAAIGRMHQDGVTAFIEVGPGRVLQGLQRRINRSLNIIGVESLPDINGIEHV